MNKKEILLKKNSRQLRSLVVDATAVTESSKILKLVEGWGGHSITYGMWKENQSTVTIKILSTIKWPYFLSYLTHRNSFSYSVKSIIILLSGRKAVEIPCGEGYAKLGKRAGERE